jgi:hypothetical protein
VSRARDLALPLAPGAPGRLLSLILAAVLYLAMVALAVAMLAERRLAMAASEPVVLDIELPAVGDPGRASAEARLAMLAIRELPGLIGVEAGQAMTPDSPEPWSAGAGPSAAMTMTAAFAADAAPSAEVLAARVAGAVGPSVIAPLPPDPDLARARDARLLGVVAGVALLTATTGLSAAAAALLARHRRATIEVLIGLGAGVGRVARALEAVTLRLTVEAAVLATFSVAATLLASRWLLALEALRPLSELDPARLVLLALVPISAVLLGTLCARLVAGRQLAALA